MKRNIILTAFAVFALTRSLVAQHVHFLNEGTIEFEKKVNMYAVIQKSITKDNEAYIQSAFDQYKKNQPQFRTMKSTLNFSKDKTLYTPAVETPLGGFFGDMPSVSQINTVYADLTSTMSVTQKRVFEETFVLKDSLRRINWKITDENREIAGYQCRRANAVIMDSVYVVAFYTDKIAVSGGPESFTGLPGMILGVALPHDNTTWFATSVIEKTLPPNTVKAPTKGKPTDKKGLMKTLDSAFKEWGDYAKTYLKAFLL